MDNEEQHGDEHTPTIEPIASARSVAIPKAWKLWSVMFDVADRSQVVIYTYAASEEQAIAKARQIALDDADWRVTEETIRLFEAEVVPLDEPIYSTNF